MRHAPFVGLLACFSLAMLATSSATAAPAGGGRYEGDVLLLQRDNYARPLAACRGCLSLTVANDGLSLDGGYLAFDVRCADREFGSVGVLVQESSPATTPIDNAGAFSWSRRGDEEEFEITGQFAADGSHVEGRLSFVTQFDARPCETRDVQFRARLTGRPARTRPGRATECASMPGRGRGSGVGARERGIGCTRAKALALAWAHDSTCRQSPSAPKCRVEGFECSGVHGGRFSAQAAVRCVTVVPPTGAVEFIMSADCGYVRSARLNLTAANTPCRRARRIGRRMPEGCGDDRVGQRCKSGRYRCRVTALSTDSTLGRCVRRDDPFSTVWFEYVWPL